MGLALLLAACSGSSVSLVPTPFPTAGTVEGTLSPESVELTLSEINSALGLHEDETIIVSGQLQRQPLLVCDSDPNPSPATWALTGDNLVLLANQFDEQVRLLLPEGLTMTVEGKLRRWNGPVGCGKQAQTQEVWYLEVSRILSPSALTQATLTPEGLVEAAQEVAGITPTLDVLETPEVPTIEATAESVEATVPAEEIAPTESLPEASATPELIDEPTVETTVISPTTTISGTATATGTATMTPGPGTPTVTPEATGGTPEATVAIGNKQVVDQGDVWDFEEFFPASTLGANEIHRWTLDLVEGDVYDIMVIAPTPANIALSLYRDGQPVIPRQNSAAAGTAEVLSISGQPEALYQILVENDQSQSAEYIMILSIPEDSEFELMGFLASDAPRNNLTKPEFVSHYWNFMANAGDEITVTVTPGGQSDPYIEFYGPGAVSLMDVDDGDIGAAEVLEYTITTSGLHTIAIDETSSEEMVYSITLSVQQ